MIFAILIRLIGAALGFTVTIAVAKNYSIEEAAVFFSFYAFVALGTAVVRFGGNHEIVRLGIDPRDSNSVFFQMSVFVFFITLILYLISTLLEFQGFISPAVDLGNLALAVVLLSCITFKSSYLQGVGKSVGSIFYLNVAYQVLFLVFIFFFNGWSLIDLFVISIFLIFFMGFISQALFSRPDFTKVRLNFRRLLGYWVHTIGAQWIVFGGVILVSFHGSSEQISVFSVCQRLALGVLFFQSLMEVHYSKILSKLISNGKVKKVGEKSIFMLFFSGGVGLSILIFFWGGADLLVSYLGDEYSTASEYLWIIFIPYFIAFMSVGLVIPISMSGRSEFLALGSLIGVISSIVFYFILFYYFGFSLEQVVVALALAYFIQFLFYIYSYFKVMNTVRINHYA